jgi:hypothetical protein
VIGLDAKNNKLGRKMRISRVDIGIIDLLKEAAAFGAGHAGFAGAAKDSVSKRHLVVRADWDPAQHPRVPKGEAGGGQFTAGVGVASALEKMGFKSTTKDATGNPIYEYANQKGDKHQVTVEENGTWHATHDVAGFKDNSSGHGVADLTHTLVHPDFAEKGEGIMKAHYAETPLGLGEALKQIGFREDAEKDNEWRGGGYVFKIDEKTGHWTMQKQGGEASSGQGVRALVKTIHEESHYRYAAEDLLAKLPDKDVAQYEKLAKGERPTDSQMAGLLHDIGFGRDPTLDVGNWQRYQSDDHTILYAPSTDAYTIYDKDNNVIGHGEGQKALISRLANIPAYQDKAMEAHSKLPDVELNPEAVNVGGSQWNKATAQRLETEYQKAAPALDQIETSVLASPEYQNLVGDDRMRKKQQPGYTPGTTKTKWSKSAPQKEDEQIEAEDWDTLGSDKQEKAKEAWMEATKDDFLESEVQNWHDNGDSKAEAQTKIANDFNDSEDNGWADDAISEAVQEWNDDHPDHQVPYDTGTILAALSISNHDDFSGYSGSKEPEFEWDDSFLKDPTDLKYDPDKQLKLEGIEPPPAHDHLTDSMREDIVNALTTAFDKKADNDAGDMDPPDYLADNVGEYQEEVWDQYDDKEKFKHAKNHLDADDLSYTIEADTPTEWDELDDHQKDWAEAAYKADGEPEALWDDLDDDQKWEKWEHYEGEGFPQQQPGDTQTQWMAVDPKKQDAIAAAFKAKFKGDETMNDWDAVSNASKLAYYNEAEEGTGPLVDLYKENLKPKPGAGPTVEEQAGTWGKLSDGQKMAVYDKWLQMGGEKYGHNLGKMADAWKGMTDEAKSYVANSVMSPEEKAKIGSEPVTPKTTPPAHYDPLNNTSGLDYRKTQVIARQMSHDRAVALLTTRGLFKQGKPKTSQTEIAAAYEKTLNKLRRRSPDPEGVVQDLYSRFENPTGWGDDDMAVMVAQYLKSPRSMNETNGIARSVWINQPDLLPESKRRQENQLLATFLAATHMTTGDDGFVTVSVDPKEIEKYAHNETEKHALQTYGHMLKSDVEDAVTSYTAGRFQESPDRQRELVKRADSRMWEAWKGSSTSPDGRAIQLATAEELGGRMRIPQPPKLTIPEVPGPTPMEVTERVKEGLAKYNAAKTPEEKQYEGDKLLEDNGAARGVKASVYEAIRFSGNDAYDNNEAARRIRDDALNHLRIAPADGGGWYISFDYEKMDPANAQAVKEQIKSIDVKIQTQLHKYTATRTKELQQEARREAIGKWAGVEVSPDKVVTKLETDANQRNYLGQAIEQEVMEPLRAAKDPELRALEEKHGAPISFMFATPSVVTYTAKDGKVVADFHPGGATSLSPEEQAFADKHRKEIEAVQNAHAVKVGKIVRENALTQAEMKFENAQQYKWPTREEIIQSANEQYKDVGGYEGMKAMLRAKWETSQHLLRKAGIHSLNLYRGLTVPGAEDAEVETVKGSPESTRLYKKVPDLQVERGGAASTTTDAGVANGWKQGNSDKITLRIQVPRTAVISLPAYGINVHSEHEVVVAGTAWKNWDAWQGAAPDYDVVKIAHHAAAPPESDVQPSSVQQAA